MTLCAHPAWALVAVSDSRGRYERCDQCGWVTYDNTPPRAEHVTDILGEQMPTDRDANDDADDVWHEGRP